MGRSDNELCNVPSGNIIDMYVIELEKALETKNLFLFNSIINQMIEILLKRHIPQDENNYHRDKCIIINMGAIKNAFHVFGDKTESYKRIYHAIKQYYLIVSQNNIIDPFGVPYNMDLSVFINQRHCIKEASIQNFIEDLFKHILLPNLKDINKMIESKPYFNFDNKFIKFIFGIYCGTYSDVKQQFFINVYNNSNINKNFKYLIEIMYLIRNVEITNVISRNLCVILNEIVCVYIKHMDSFENKRSIYFFLDLLYQQNKKCFTKSTMLLIDSTLHSNDWQSECLLMTILRDYFGSKL